MFIPLINVDESVGRISLQNFSPVSLCRRMVESDDWQPSVKPSFGAGSSWLQTRSTIVYDHIFLFFFTSQLHTAVIPAIFWLCPLLFHLFLFFFFSVDYSLDGQTDDHELNCVLHRRVVACHLILQFFNLCLTDPECVLIKFKRLLAYNAGYRSQLENNSIKCALERSMQDALSCGIRWRTTINSRHFFTTVENLSLSRKTRRWEISNHVIMLCSKFQTILFHRIVILRTRGG